MLRIMNERTLSIISEDNDRLFVENVDDVAEWVGMIKHTLRLIE